MSGAGWRALACIAGAAVLGPRAGIAQAASASATATVTANNLGAGRLVLSSATFSWGTVDANGSSFGTPNVIAGGASASRGIYTNVPGSLTWRYAAAPPQTVSIRLSSVPADHTSGAMADDDLAVQLPVATVGGGMSQGFQPFTSAGLLISGVTARNGANTARGNIDLRLLVLNTDPPGANTWIVRLTATGT